MEECFRCDIQKKNNCQFYGVVTSLLQESKFDALRLEYYDGWMITQDKIEIRTQLL